MQEKDISESELQEAKEYYERNGDKTIKEITSKIKKMYGEFGGDVDEGDQGAVERKKTLSLDDIVEVIQTLSDRVGAATDAFVTAFKKQYGHPNSAELLNLFQEGMIKMTEE
jgi:hypothetical protein